MQIFVKTLTVRLLVAAEPPPALEPESQTRESENENGMGTGGGLCDRGAHPMRGSHPCIRGRWLLHVGEDHHLGGGVFRHDRQCEGQDSG